MRAEKKEQMRQRQQRQQQNQTMIIRKKYRKCVENICAIANICAQTTSTHAFAMRTTANTHRTKENLSVCVCHAVLRSVPFRFRFGWRANSVHMHFPLKIRPNGSFSMCVHIRLWWLRVCRLTGGKHTHRVYRVNRRVWIFRAFSFTATFESSERRSVFRERVLLWLLPNAHSKINSVSIVQLLFLIFYFPSLFCLYVFSLFHCTILIFYRICECVVSAKAIRNNNWFHKGKKNICI